MHMIFTEEELQWIQTKVFGWPIKDDCPDEVKKSIISKKKIIDEQMKRDTK